MVFDDAWAALPALQVTDTLLGRRPVVESAQCACVKEGAPGAFRPIEYPLLVVVGSFVTCIVGSVCLPGCNLTIFVLLEDRKYSQERSETPHIWDAERNVTGVR